MHPEVEQLRKLPIAEKLRVVEELWDEIGHSDESFPLPLWHRVEADRRAAELDADSSLALSREELWRRVENRKSTGDMKNSTDRTGGNGETCAAATGASDGAWLVCNLLRLVK